MNLPPGSSRRQEAHSNPNVSFGKRSEPRYLGSYVRLGVSWPQCVSEIRRSFLPMNLPQLESFRRPHNGRGRSCRRDLTQTRWPGLVRNLLLLLAGFLVVISVPVMGADAPFKLPVETAKLKPGPGLALANSQCLLCHSADYMTTQPRLSAAQWRAVIVKMQAKYGAPIVSNNVEALVVYLTQNYGVESGTNAPSAQKRP